MTPAQKMYYEGMGCSCHKCAPCSFCMSLDETEADLFWAGQMKELSAYWKMLEEVPEEPESQWVTIYDYAT